MDSSLLLSHIVLLCTLCCVRGRRSSCLHVCEPSFQSSGWCMVSETWWVRVCGRFRVLPEFSQGVRSVLLTHSFCFATDTFIALYLDQLRVDQGEQTCPQKLC